MISFSIGNKYKDKVWCDVVAMDACHLLLGKPWQYDCRVTHDGHTNTYSFYGYTNTYSFFFNNTKIVLLPSRDVNKSKPTGENTNLLSLMRFKEEMRDTDTIFVLIGKKASRETKVSEIVVSLIAEFHDVFSDELPDGLPLLRDIQHQIDLESGAMLPNRPYFRMSPNKHEELQRQVEELLVKGHMRESLSSCAVPALLTPKKDGS